MRKLVMQVKRIIVILIVLMITFNHINILVSSFISLAVENSDERITYSASFVVIESDEEQGVNNEVQLGEDLSNEENDVSNEISEETTIITQIDDENANVEDLTQDEEVISSEESEEKLANDEIIEVDEEKSENESSSEIKEATIQEENEFKPEEKVEEYEDTKGFALQITLGLKTKGYLKNAKVDIKDLASQNFKIRENLVLSEYVQSIEENKIRFKQINGGTEVNVYIPIELKEEEQIDIAKLQSGVELNLTCTNVTEEGEEEIITKSVRPVLEISNDMDLIIESEAEKFIPYIIEGRREAQTQLRVSIGTRTKNNLPINDTKIEMPLPQIEGATIKDVNVQSLSTGYTNGKLNGDVIFTNENWSFQEGVVQINANNSENNGRYQMNNGDDVYIISYIYENIPEEFNNVKTTINAMANVFTSTGTNEIKASLEQEYDLSHANSNIVTYNVLRKTQQISKGYLYANANAEETEYIVEYDNSIDINISRPELVNVIQINEQEEYFVIDENNKYETRSESGENTYYERIRLNKQNLDSIIGEEGNLELLLENGTSLITIDQNTPDDGDGNLSISFENNKIGRIIIKINNPIGEGILSLVATKGIEKTSYSKQDILNFKLLQTTYSGKIELKDNISSELEAKTIETTLKDTITNSKLSFNRTSLSTLVNNEDIEMSISLNNGNDESDMYTNPVFEVTFPEIINDITINDYNLIYGSENLKIGKVDKYKNKDGNIVIKVELIGSQNNYNLGSNETGTSIILKTNIEVKKYSIIDDKTVKMKYFNQDATGYREEKENDNDSLPDNLLIKNIGYNELKLNIIQAEGIVNAQIISNYNGKNTVTSINQGIKEDKIQTGAKSQIAEMKLILMNNSDESIKNVHILGRTIFSGNKSIIKKEELGTDLTAYMKSMITPENNKFSQTIYYSENEEATDDLENAENKWTTKPDNIEKIKSYLIVINEEIEKGSVLGFVYNFEIPEDLTNNINLAGTFATFYNKKNKKENVEADKVILTTGDAPILKVETLSNINDLSAVVGQLITYRVRVTNEGRSVSKNTIINSIIPAGTVYIENGKEMAEINELKFNLGDIWPGETIEKEYTVKIKSDITSINYLETANAVEADGLEKPLYSSTPAVPIENAELEISINNEKDGEIIKQDTELWYTVNITNLSNKDYENCVVKTVLPEGLIYEDAYIIGESEDGIDEKKISKADYNNLAREIEWKIDKLENSVSLKMILKTDDISEPSKDIGILAKISSPNLRKEYISNELKQTIAKPVIEYSFKSNTNNQFIKEGDYIEYILDIKNVGLVGYENFELSNAIPDSFKVVGANVIKLNSANSVLVSQKPEFKISLDSNESAKLVLGCVANSLNGSNNVIAQNGWTIEGNGIETIKTEKIKNIVEKNVENTTEDEINENISLPEVASAEIEDNNKQYQNKNTYVIMGRAFSDLDDNGEFDDDEDGMSNIVAKLYDTKTQKIVAQTVTNSIGEYLFDNVENGEYFIKFEYENTKYKLSHYRKDGVSANKSSDAIISKNIAVTDKIKINNNSISDINIGLVRSGIFDFDLSVNINQVTVQDDEKVSNFEMENLKLAKVDINPKKIDESKVFIKYNIVVSNKGEIEGSIKRIVDYLPKELEFDAELNSEWYTGTDGFIYTDKLSDKILKPGENETLTLILTKQMNENGTGLINNNFEIEKVYNEFGMDDIDSIAGNNSDGEDDMDSADIIIGIQTGGNVINVMIISITLVALLIVLYVIKVLADRKSIV